MQNEEGKNWEGVRRSGSDVDIIPDVKTQISQRWFGSPLKSAKKEERCHNYGGGNISTYLEERRNIFRQSELQPHAAGNL